MDLLTVTCPRCGAEADERFYGPCTSCRTELRAKDGEVVPGMVLCCESYIGRAGGLEGVKLEQQVLVTDKGYELLSTFPFEDGLLGREI